MLILSGICGIMTLFVYMTNAISKKRKEALMLLELSAMFLLIADRRAYIYRGDTSALGWWMVRISNFLVFFLTLVVIYSFNLYLIDLFTHEGRLERTPRRLKAVHILALLGMAMVIVSQYTGFYYTFDELNRYQRAPGFIVCYLIPLSILILQVSVIMQYRRRLSRSIGLSLLMFASLSIVASVFQVFMYGISLNNMTIVSTAALLYVFALQDMNREVERARKMEIEYYKDEQQKMHAMFEQTAEALANAIDAKDKYTHGHSTRVAMYSTQIAREAGKSEEECEKVYFAALLHDVGKIGVSDAIINKDGKLTNEEFAQIRLHPVFGNQILSSIQQSPYLSIGAHYHHERYDGKGYPEGLKGEDIPEIARIIAVADSYDAMTSKRSYRDPLPQQIVREELVKGRGTQFDPEYAQIMLHLIDNDVEYRMREREEATDEAFITRLHCESIYRDCSVGFLLSDNITKIRLYSKADEGFPKEHSLPSLVIFDALDGRIHEDAHKQNDLLYLEYGQIRFDGRTLSKEARKIETRVFSEETDVTTVHENGAVFTAYEIYAVRYKDHAMIRISNGEKTVQSILALPDSTRFAYLSLTGEHCMITNIHVDQDAGTVDDDYIPRIAEEISYIKDEPQGDVPNIQIDGWRTQATQGIPVRGNIELRFHTQSLPTARLVWHCPFVTVFTSKDGAVGGEDYREFLLLRLDGESWESDSHVANKVEINHTADFESWNALIYLTAFFGPWTFSYDAEGYFVRGPLGYTAHCISFLLLVSNLIVTTLHFRKSSGKEKLIPVINMLIVLLGIFMDSRCRDSGTISFTDICAVFCCVFYYIWLHLCFVREHEQALIAEQRIQIMMSQIQPHFLYNTLTTIQALCLENPRKAAAITEKFAVYLRQNIDSLNETNLIPFRKELDHTLVYAQVEMERFPNIHLDYEIEDEDFSLPALTVQPLVENAIRHGVRGKTKGQIDIITNLLPDCHEIIIRDNGKGFSAADAPGTGGSHIGIQNVRERLERLCGGTLAIESRPGQGTCVTIHIPRGKERL